MKHHLWSLVLLIIFFLFGGCEKDDPIPPASNKSIVYDVTYTDNTVFIDSLDAQSLIRIDEASHIYYFEISDPKIADLRGGFAPGDRHHPKWWRDQG